MSILLAFLAATCWGLADYLGGLHAKRSDLVVVTMSREIVGFLFFVVLLLLTEGSPQRSDLAIGFGVGLAVGVALPIFFGRLASGRMALVAPVAGSVGAGVPIVVGILSGERLSLFQAFGLVLAVAAIALVSIEHVEHDGGRRRHIEISDVVVAAICGVAFGIFFTGMHHTSKDSGFWPSISVNVGVMVMLGLFAAFRRPAVFAQLRPSAIWRFGVGGLLDGLAAALFLLATREGLLSITAGVASLYPVGTALLATWLLKEHLNRLNVLGLLLCGASLTFVTL
jgi:uncharacterized membrane protein